MVLKEAQLDIIRRIDAFLTLQSCNIGCQRRFSLHIVHEIAINVVIIADIKRLIQLAVAVADHPTISIIPCEGWFYRFRQPDAARSDRFNLFAGTLPELQRHQGRYVTPETIHDLRPHFQRFNLVVPQIRLVVIQINDVGPLAHMIAEAAIRLAIEPLRMMFPQPGVR